MKELQFFYENSIINKSLIRNYIQKLENETKNLSNTLSLGYTTEYGFINLVDDRNMLLKIKNLVKTKKEEDLEYLVIVGIGGSNLGTIAVLEAVKGKFYNYLHNSPKILFVDTVDSDYLSQVIHLIEDSFKAGRKVLINLVSKSGTTLETIANFEVLISIIKKYAKNYENYVVVTTDKDSELYKIALENRFDILEVPKSVGGRFSVFSSVSLFPLAMVNINIEKLVYGAKIIRKRCLSLKENFAAISAIIIYLHYQNKRNIYDSFLFSNEFEALGKWYRQLLAESVGKEFNKHGNKVNIGITPTVSIGSTDLHSVFQLYTAGPKDKLINIISVENSIYIKIPDYKDYNKLIKDINNKSLDKVMNAIIKAVKKNFISSEIPFTEILLYDKDEFSIGQFLMLKQIEVVLLANLFNINPFDQPNIESYKEETKKLLKK